MVAQRCLAKFVDRHRSSLNVVGVFEVFEKPGNASSNRASHLLAIGSVRKFKLFQNRGMGARGCSLLPEQLIEAGELVRAEIDRGCDLVVLSKFGKLEAECGSGLVPAFVSAIEAQVPILTSVSSRFQSAWEAFASPMFRPLRADCASLDQWWQDSIGISRRDSRPSSRQAIPAEQAERHQGADERDWI